MVPFKILLNLGKHTSILDILPRPESMIHIVVFINATDISLPISDGLSELYTCCPLY